MKNIALKAISVAIGSFLSISVYAQQDMPDTAVFTRIKHEELSNSHIPEIAHNLTDAAGSRLTNSPGFKRAGDWAITTMKKWGLTNAAFEPWGEFGKGWELEDFSIVVNKPFTKVVIAYPEPWTGNTNGPQQGEVVLVDQANMFKASYIDKHAAEFKGKIILVTGPAVDFNVNFQPAAKRYTAAELDTLQDSYMIPVAMIDRYKAYFKVLQESSAALKKTGVLAVISTEGGNNNGVVFVQGYIGYKLNDAIGVPKVSMGIEDALQIKRMVEGGQHVELSINIKGRFTTDAPTAYNVVAEIPGTDPKLKSQLVMLGGHLDAWASSTGATDNGAGCTVMMEAVRLIQTLKLHPKRTIRIALWSGEEQGVLGSYNYVKNHFRAAYPGDAKPEQKYVSAYFNLDNGTGKIRGIYAQGNTAVKPIFEQWLKPFYGMGAQTVTLKNTGSTDHLPFDWAGIPGFQFIQDPIDYETRTHHSNMDNYDHLQMDDLKQAAIIVASFVYQTSVRADMLPRKDMPAEKFVFDGF
ncbi:M28 family peptidase [Mucilaginibacter sp.]|uniref:M28 family peptidase n=1 Tax=Mucilaginibacter sp. TaxID=1882438 RepID=UPI003D0C33E0